MFETCQRCNRKLKNPKNKELGFGKICLIKHQEELKQIVKDATQLN